MKCFIVSAALLLCLSLHRVQCHDLFATLTKLHEEMQRKASNIKGKYVLSTTRGTLGLGNRMLAHASAFAFALLHNRTLLMHSPDCELEHIFASPWPGAFEMKQKQFNKLFKRQRFSGSVLWIDTSHDASLQDWLNLACSENFDDSDAIILNGGQYFLPLLAARNPEWFQNVFGDDLNGVYGRLAKYLFRPSSMVQKLYNEHYKFAREAVGLQFRSFMLRYDQLQDILADKCMARLGIDSENLFIASLYPEHSKWFKENRKSRTKMISSYQQQDTSVAQLQHAFAEMLLLARTKALITSPFSTFGYTAAALRDDPTKVFMLDKRLSCRSLNKNLEPCFHKAPSALTCPDGSALFKQTSMLSACPDYHKRGIKLRM